MENTSCDLTLEQQFEMKRMRDAANQMSREQALDLLVQASRLLMIKTNVIRDLGK
ncbi:NblA/ycf18 family protein [Crocosphaera watsonii WH 8501]|uniref:Phycobilisome degradation protein NblA n=5 Tax=Crocosphaera watsonii TaxID=263511 RepID=T2JR58_CROWT|nr:MULTISPECIES: NblA/ycf18 family protein [Crocosphaera]EHJ10911.1 Phycobilisome degradation protein nblA [Crocosphaera watsonii WH 0003]MCH2245887.1 NblA/ycf18 family protein [Crocosphaera sp.]NQZ60996.1 NblA/ycf18 family protein [Crocosphaera sp.]CCQ52604.1 phycobilisome degradation protein; NblA [Crocosphaera watsonii WH 8502]CCQ57397.1 phycobilisome degradation protein; NblA [Crocosphaera watsonii WH 0005]